LIANISGTDQAIDKRKTALSTTIIPTFDEINLVNFSPLTKKRSSPLKFNRVRLVTRYMLMQTIINLSATVYELSCEQRKKLWRNNPYCPSLPRTVIITARAKLWLY